MALETVTVRVVSDDLVPVPVDGVVVRVYDSTGTTLLTSGTSGGVTPGEVEFTLNGDLTPTEYQLRFYIVGGAIQSPQQIAVYSPATPVNVFQVEASLFVRPTSPDPLLCRVSGYVVRPNGAPLNGCDLHFVHCQTPILSSGRIVLGERVAVRTNTAGYTELDLIRGGTYLVTVQNYEDVPREVEVPDASSASLADLLFPIPIQVTFDPVGPWALNVNEELVLSPEVLLSSGVTIEGPAIEDLEYTVTDSALASLTYTDTTITVRGNAAGSTTLQIRRRDTSVRVLPDPGITGSTVNITVV